MRIRSLEIRENRARLGSPLRGAIDRWSERRGLWIGLDAGESFGQGEASPLPGYSPDTLDDCRSALRSLESNILGTLSLESLVRPPSWLTALPSAARFALETALVDCLGKTSGRPAWRVLLEVARQRHGQTAFPPPRVEPPLSRLLQSESIDDVCAEAAAARRYGLRGVKVKIDGRRPIEELVERLKTIRAQIGEPCALRLDAGGSVPPRRARPLLEALASVSPELIEEPVPYEALAALDAPAIGIALDESLQRPGAWETLEERIEALRLVAMVLKPAALGGLVACLDWAAKARARRLLVIVSHLFDGPVALASAAHLALAAASPQTGQGLDRHGGLEAWPEMRLPIIGATSLSLTSSPGLGLEKVPLT